jgi:PAS domain S-box-containing protein
MIATHSIKTAEAGAPPAFSRGQTPPRLPALGHLALEMIDEGVCVTDAQGRYVEVNAGYAQLYGYRREELIGRHFTLVLPPEARQRAQQMYDAYIQGKAGELAREWYVQRRDGTIIEVFVRSSRFTLPDGSVYKITVVRDLTEEKAMKRRITSLMHEKEMAFDA